MTTPPTTAPADVPPPDAAPADTVIALDVGGSRLKGAVVDAGGTAAATVEWRLTPEDGADAVVTSVLSALVNLRHHPAAAHARAAGLAVPGLVDTTSGRAIWSENLRWNDVPIRALAEERTGLPVALGHDVRAGGLAEVRAGAARGADHALVVPVGTGIAAAIVVDGMVIDGRGLAGELGHVDVGYDEPCACGARGCTEAVASAAAIARRYTRRCGLAVDGAADVLERKHAGDPDAEAVWAEAIDALSRALATACSLLAPEVVVIGGGLAKAGAELFDPLSDRLAGRLTFQDLPRIVPAALGDRAGCIGAAMMARDLVERGGTHS
ncbi:ROK family protein [Actinobacteria bacterium YIM 96077]|uniref:ROK family protein n=1 Tax=Phytoactinopolyspora halophila TaxID=1981511 RepID=A0A329R2Z8_9ACTN|nr:ROK family protein [Phytoactinopolyspora halophila]AYY11685.1 ROK family protein [Actinobacteria bacterium YIM 96077]RAW17882.1 ROK family protein [Phytoactinopolyspora halophila]